MSLSTRAKAYLDSLYRYKPQSCEVAAEAIKRAASPVFDAWLDFQEHYAGYEEKIWHDTAIWGIIHSDDIQSTWTSRGEVQVEYDKAEDKWYIGCAEVHPSYDYRLDQDGEFKSVGGGGDHQTFDVKVERDALIWEIWYQKKGWRENYKLAKMVTNLKRLLEVTDAEPVPEASDKYGTTWKTAEVIIVKHNERIRIWASAGASEKLSLLLVN